MQADLEALSTAALLGTEKRDVPVVGDDLRVAVSEGVSAEARLLCQGFAAKRFVSAAAEAAEDARFLADAALPDDKPVMSKAAQRFLKQMLRGRNNKSLLEFLRVLAASGQRVPHVLLPDLLSLAQSRVALRELVVACMDQRGKWLCQQNEDWPFVSSSKPLEQFELGIYAERRIALLSLRQQDAEAARQQLEAVWKQENAKTRAGLLSCLEEGLSLNDEGFLEQALQDKSVSVREQAAELLNQLPESSYVAAMIERAKPLLSYQAGGMLGLKKASLEINLPELVEVETLEIPVSSTQGKGKRTWWFVQLLARAPLSIWSKQADLTQLLDAADKGHRDLILGAWAKACLRFKDSENAKKLIAYQADYETVMTLASMLNKDDTADLAYQLLSQRPQLSRDHLVLRLLETSECNWSINLKLQFIKSLRQALKKWEKNWQARSIIDGLAQKLPVEMLEDLENIAPHDQNHALFASYKELLASISFRKDMLAALET